MMNLTLGVGILAIKAYLCILHCAIDYILIYAITLCRILRME